MNYMNDETGAVTVDWVVLTAGLVGLGIAAMAVVSSGVQDASGDINASLTRSTVFNQFANTVSDTFENGLQGWTVLGNTYDDPTVEGSETILMRDGNSLQKTFDIEDDANFAIVTIDLTAIGVLEREEKINFSVGGVDIGTVEFNGTSGAVIEGDLTIEKTGVVIDSAETIATREGIYATTTNLNSNNDNLNRTSSHIVQFVVENPGSELDLQMDLEGKIVNNTVPGEALSLQDVTIVTTDNLGS